MNWIEKHHNCFYTCSPPGKHKVTNILTVVYTLSFTEQRQDDVYTRSHAQHTQEKMQARLYINTCAGSYTHGKNVVRAENYPLVIITVVPKHHVST